MIVRNFEYLIALGRELHFARAAEACHVSQPTLSAGIRQLEEDMGVLLVKRGSRLQGFTPEGARVLEMARQMLADCERLKRDLKHLRQELSGNLSIATIPALLPMLASISVSFSERHPGAEMHLRSFSRDTLLAGLREGDLDIVFSYLSETVPHGLQSYPLYREKYFLFLPENLPQAAERSVTWEQVRQLPLCLLASATEPLASHHSRPGAPVVHCDTADVLATHLRTGRWCSVIPQSLAITLESIGGLRAVPLANAPSGETVGFLTRDRTPLPPLVHAFLELPHDAAMVPLLRKRLSAHKKFLASSNSRRQTARPASRRKQAAS